MDQLLIFETMDMDQIFGWNTAAATLGKNTKQ
jgi:hypothetical protein